MTNKLKASVSYESELYRQLQDSEFAADYINAAMEDGDPEGFLLALRHLVEARGGFSEIARKTGLERRQLYRTLSERGNPRLSSLDRLLKSLGLHLTVSPTNISG